jgi:hypothetical protein
MYACKMCGRKFKTSQELAGHTSSAHPKTKHESVPDNNPDEIIVEAVSEETQRDQPSPSVEEDPGVMDRIRELSRKGYSPKQIKELFGYNPRTVDQVGEEFIEPDVVPEKEKHNGFPVTRKSGSGQEMLNPEVILQSYLLQDGDAGAWMFKGMMLLRAAQLMNMDMMNMRKTDAEADAKRLEPLMRMIQTSREEMDAAAQRNQESMTEVAMKAGSQAGGMAMQHIDQRFDEFRHQKKDIADTPDPMKGMMARMMETVMNQLTGQMFGGQGGGQSGQTGTGMPPGFEDKRS